MNQAGPAEILRSAQKDVTFIQRLQSDVKEIAQAFKGDGWWLRWHRHLDGCVEYLYFLLTTIDGSQTLGEEYSGLVQVDRDMRVPGRLRRLCLVTLQVLGPLIVRRALQRLQRSVDNGQSSPLPMRAIPALVAFLQQLHLAIFYLGAGFYHIAKRITGVNYLLARPWMGAGSTAAGGSSSTSIRDSFRLLGVLSLAQLFVSAALQLRGSAAAAVTAPSSGTPDCGDAQPSPTAAADVSGGPPTSGRQVGYRCALCLTCPVVATPTATPCGHVYCWQCVVEWLQTQPLCAVCRAPVTPSRLVPLIRRRARPAVSGVHVRRP